MRYALALLAALLALPAAGCGGEEPAKPAAGDGGKAAEKPPGEAAPKPADPSLGAGLDLDSLRKAAEARGGKPAAEAGAPKPEEAKPGEAEAAKPAEAGPGEAKPAEAKPAGPPPPVSPDEITDTEVLATWSVEEREALMEMPEAERAKEIRKRRLEMFKERGGVLAADSGKMADQAADPETGERGPARPTAPKKDAPPPELADILRNLASGDAEVRAEGAEAARKFPDPAVAVPHLLPLLADPDADLRAIAASVLGTLRRPEAIAPLAKVVEKGDKDPVRAAAIRAIQEIGGKEGGATLRGIAREGENPSDRSAALLMLAKFKDAELVRDLVKPALVDLAPDVRQQAASLVREFKLKECEKELLPLLQDFSEQVTLEAIRALGEIGARSAVGPILRILFKPDPESEDPENLQNVANLALEKITETKQGFDSTLPDDRRKAAIDSWRAWWQANKDKWK